jgi:hypothetical protein
MSALSDARTLYGCNKPVQPKAYLVLFIGNSMVNGFSTEWASMGDPWLDVYMPVTPLTKYKLFTDDYTFINPARYPNGFHILNFQNYVVTMADLYDTGVYSDGELYCLQYAVNGTCIVQGEESVTWDAAEAGGYLDQTINKLLWGIKDLYYKGKEVEIIAVNASIHVAGNGGDNGTTVVATYTEKMNGIMDKLRNSFPFHGGSTMSFIWGAPDGIALQPASLAYREAALALNGPLIEVFDINQYRPQANDTIHLREAGVNSFGKFVSSAIVKMKTGNDFPSCSNVVITGTLQVNQYVGCTWDYSDTEGDPEGTSLITLTYADDANGTNEIFLYSMGKGSTKLMTVTYLNKYIRARIEPIASSGARVGKAVYGNWQGPVIG